MDRIKYLADCLGKYNIELTKDQADRFLAFHELLEKWNEKMNLTGITDYEEACIKHYADSAALVLAEPSLNDKRIMDVGTGAGFPGIPLKILFPESEITLLDSLGKRITFLKTVINDLGLKNAEAVHGRAEEFVAEVERRESYDICVSRAVADLRMLAELCMPYVKVGGVFISYKSVNTEEELTTADNAIKTLGGELEQLIKFELPVSGEPRQLVVIRKKESTDMKYPRRFARISKKPL